MLHIGLTIILIGILIIILFIQDIIGIILIDITIGIGHLIIIILDHSGFKRLSVIAKYTSSSVVSETA